MVSAADKPRRLIDRLIKGRYIPSEIKIYDDVVKHWFAAALDIEGVTEERSHVKIYQVDMINGND